MTIHLDVFRRILHPDIDRVNLNDRSVAVVGRLDRRDRLWSIHRFDSAQLGFTAVDRLD
jgi:hypothetical protein